MSGASQAVNSSSVPNNPPVSREMKWVVASLVVAGLGVMIISMLASPDIWGGIPTEVVAGVSMGFFALYAVAVIADLKAKNEGRTSSDVACRVMHLLLIIGVAALNAYTLASPTSLPLLEINVFFSTFAVVRLFYGQADPATEVDKKEDHKAAESKAPEFTPDERAVAQAFREFMALPKNKDNDDFTFEGKRGVDAERVIQIVENEFRQFKLTVCYTSNGPRDIQIDRREPPEEVAARGALKAFISKNCYSLTQYLQRAYQLEFTGGGNVNPERLLEIAQKAYQGYGEEITFEKGKKPGQIFINTNTSRRTG